MSDAERNRLWREANPDKVKAQRERRRLRKLGLLPPEVKPTPEERAARNKAKAKEYNRRYRAAHKEEIQEKQRVHWRKYYRLRNGIPLDAPSRVPKYATDEERRAAKREAKRRCDAKKRGTTVEEIEARKAAREAAKLAKAERAAEDAAKRAECLAQRAQRKAEQKAAAERSKRRAAPVVKPAAKPAPPPPAPVNTNAPPELVELFRKASKGAAPMPFNPRVRKLSVWNLRGVR